MERPRTCAVISDNDLEDELKNKEMEAIIYLELQTSDALYGFPPTRYYTSISSIC